MATNNEQRKGIAQMEEEEQQQQTEHGAGERLLANSSNSMEKQQRRLSKSKEHGKAAGNDGLAEEGLKQRTPPKAVKLFVNFCVVISVAVSWACAVQFRKSTMVDDPSHFYAPYAMVWFSTSFMLLCYPAFLLYVRCTGKQILDEHREALNIFGRKSGLRYFSTFLWRELLFLTLWTAINYAYAQSLGLISASAASSIMSANVAVICILGWVMLKEPFNVVKTLAVLLAIAGVVVVSLDAEFAGNPLGISLVVLSAMAAAFYKVFFKLLHGSASLGGVSLFMSGLGALNLTLNTPVTILMVYFGLDRLGWSYIPWLPLLGSALLGLIFNFLVNFGIILLDPLVISIGMIFGIPLSAVIDLLFRSLTVSVEFLIGSALICISFILIAFPVDELLKKVRAKNEEKEEDDIAKRVEKKEGDEVVKLDE